MAVRPDACETDRDDHPVLPRAERRPLRACPRCGHEWFECGIPQRGVAFDRVDDGWRCRRCGSVIPRGW